MMDSLTPVVDGHSEEEVRAYFSRLEREYPQLVEALKVMNISYQQYLAALHAMSQRSSFSSNTTRLAL